MSGSAADPPRCAWAVAADGRPVELMTAYHDDEWGQVQRDDRRLFEKLCLEAFQSGLSWLTILRKRESFQRAFAGFEPARVARFDDADRARLMADSSIVRNRAKIDAVIWNAGRFDELVAREGPFAEWIDRTIPVRGPLPPDATMADLPAETAESASLARALRDRGFRFVGPTTAYAFMQATGIVDDHLPGCFRYRG
ncbi:MAG TPA: DNA-3-methyladenine glycosylase I [Candidatus Limnocylindrales bacterium]|nr:DNA-3-methyladenine glycosylase I [Candidatus Limnocylindrales bacterium]